MVRNILTIALLLIINCSFASEMRQLIREGNKLFEEGRYVEAEDKYRQSLEIDEHNHPALFNLGNTLYRQGRLEEAKELFNMLSNDEMSDPDRAKVLHNLGNAFLGSGQIPESIETYKRALRVSPDDDDTRYNLAYALNLLDEMPPQEQPQDGDGEDQDNQEEQPEDGRDDDNGDDEQQHQPDDQNQELADDSPPQPIDGLSYEEAERILEALRQQEQEVQREINREDHRSEPVRTEREW